MSASGVSSHGPPTQKTSELVQQHLPRIRNFGYSPPRTPTLVLITYRWLPSGTDLLRSPVKQVSLLIGCSQPAAILRLTVNDLVAKLLFVSERARSLGFRGSSRPDLMGWADAAAKADISDYPQAEAVR